MTFLGHVSDRTKFEELSSAWVHLLPSVKEGWGLSIVEAAARRRALGGLRRRGRGARVDPRRGHGLLALDLPDLIEQVDRLLSDASLRRDLGVKAQVRSEQFTWEATATTVASVSGAADLSRATSSPAPAAAVRLAATPGEPTSRCPTSPPAPPTPRPGDHPAPR